MTEDRRSIRKGIEEILAALRSDVELGEEFDAHEYTSLDPDPDCDLGLKYIFELSGMDPGKHGHWQILLRALADQVYPSPGGRPEVWTDQEHKRLLKAVLASRRKSESASIKSICEELSGSFTIDLGGKAQRFDAKTLQHRVHRLLKEARAAVKAGTASKLQKDITTKIKARF